MIIYAINKNHFAGNRKRRLVMLSSFSLVGLIILTANILGASYRSDRINAFFTGFLSKRTGGQIDSTGIFYQQAMADKWLKASVMFGATAEKINNFGLDRTMPSVTTDFALINVFASLGWFMGIALILSIIIYISRMFTVTKKIKDSYGFYLSFGACVYLAAQFISGILVNFGLLPTMSVTIPFISYGGVGYITNMAMIGLILSVWRRNNLLPARNIDNGAPLSLN
jgi:cell division protein FtsW (lipid II flippase)